MTERTKSQWRKYKTMLDAAKARLGDSEMKPCRSIGEKNDILLSKLLLQGILSNICVS